MGVRLGVCFSFLKITFQYLQGFNACNSKTKQTANRALRLIGFHGRLVSHGMRAIASTYLNERLINSDVIESCLAHGIRDQVRKAYNRADYLEERRKVMQIWGDYVESCSNGL